MARAHFLTSDHASGDILRGTTVNGIAFSIVNPILPIVILSLRAEQSVIAEAGAMTWKTYDVKMDTSLQGGLGGLLKRVVVGESIFMTTFTATKDNSEVAFAGDMPGRVMPVHLQAGQSVIAQRTALLCADSTISTNVHFQRNLGAGLFGGEGFILQKHTGPGTVFLTLDGEVVEYTLEPGERMAVDTGHVAALEPSVQFNIEFVKGIKNLLFGGEGLFLAVLTGPGRVWLQSLPAAKFAGIIARYMPRAEGQTQSLLNPSIFGE